MARSQQLCEQKNDSTQKQRPGIRKENKEWKNMIAIKG